MLTTAEIEILKKIAFLFKHNREGILTNWITAARREQITRTSLELDYFQGGFEQLLDDFIAHLIDGDLNCYYQGNSVIARRLANNDVSLGKFIHAFHLFEESYLELLLSHVSPEEVIASLSAMDVLHHETISLVAETYLEVKDVMVFALVRLAELRDPETEQHLERTREYAALLAGHLRLDEEFVGLIYKAGPLHDIGKVGVRDSILLKPGPLTPDEYEAIKAHCLIGGQMLQRIIDQLNTRRGYFVMAKEIVQYHHEHYDGTGYPEGLSGADIPLAARIFALADAYDAIVSKRLYKPAYPHEAAVERIQADAGSHFDPDIVKVFMEIHPLFAAIHKKYRE